MHHHAMYVNALMIEQLSSANVDCHVDEADDIADERIGMYVALINMRKIIHSKKVMHGISHRK